MEGGSSKPPEPPLNPPLDEAPVHLSGGAMRRRFCCCNWIVAPVVSGDGLALGPGF